MYFFVFHSYWYFYCLSTIYQMCMRNGLHLQLSLLCQQPVNPLPIFHFQLLPFAILTEVIKIFFLHSKNFKNFRPFYQKIVARESAATKFVNGSTQSIWLQNICYDEFTNTSLANEGAQKDNSEWNTFRQYLLNISQPCTEMLQVCRFALDDFKCMEIFDTVLSDEGSIKNMSKFVCFEIELFSIIFENN